MGIYCMSPPVLEHIPAGVPFGFDDLMCQLLGLGRAVHVYQHDGFWLDIGRVDDFKRAQEISWDEQPSDAISAVAA
jgi:NDP-sugar pyrophosphorylase family protein